MTSKAHVEYDLAMDAVRLAVTREQDGHRQVLLWAPLGIARDPEEPNDEFWLRLPESDARAIYEALGDYFGHAGHDVRALRKDYDSERARTDLLIRHLIAQ